MAETGHARNVSNFSTLISFCIGYGGDYKPTNALIEIPAMQALLASALNSRDAVTNAVAPWKVNVNARENENEGIHRLSTSL